MSDLITVLYRIARTGQPVPTDAPAPPDYVPWPHAPITWTRIEGDYGPGIVRPRDSITTRADKHGEGAVYLAPGRYRITLPSRDTRDVTVSAEPAEIDLSSLLAGGITPEDPAYPTLLSLIETALEDTGDTQTSRVIAEGDTQVQRVADAGTERIGEVEVAIEAAGTVQVVRVEGAGDAQVARLATAGDDRIGDVEAAIAAAGDTQVGRVEDEGDTQVQRVIDAGDALDVPLPVGQPDGRVLLTRGGALQYAPDLAAAVAVAGANPALVTVYETGRRAVSSNTSAYGLKTDSGHTWEAVQGTAGISPTLVYHTNGYLYASTGSSGANNFAEAGKSLIAESTHSFHHKRIRVVMDTQTAGSSNIPRYIVIHYVNDENAVWLETSNYSFTLSIMAGGVVTSLASFGNSNNGDKSNEPIVDLMIRTYSVHGNFASGSRAIEVYQHGHRIIRAGLASTYASVYEAPGKVGIAVRNGTPIFGFSCIQR